MAERSQTSPWLYVGLGCLLAVVLVVGSCVAIGWFGIEKAKEMAEEMTDPEKREAKVLATLGAEELPPGYYPVMAMSMPMGVMEMAMLSDEPPREGEEGRDVPTGMGDGDTGFLYVAQREFGDASNDELSAYLRGESRDRGPLDHIQTNVRIDEREVIDRGELEIEGVRYLWAAHRGTIDTGARGTDAVLTIFQALCPEIGNRVRTGIWWVPLTERMEPEGDEYTAEPADPDLSGTPADPQALREFIGHFDLCG